MRTKILSLLSLLTFSVVGAVSPTSAVAQSYRASCDVLEARQVNRLPSGDPVCVDYEGDFTAIIHDAHGFDGLVTFGTKDGKPYVIVGNSSPMDVTAFDIAEEGRIDPWGNLNVRLVSKYKNEIVALLDTVGADSFILAIESNLSSLADFR